eukprot:RCo004918
MLAAGNTGGLSSAEASDSDDDGCSDGTPSTALSPLAVGALPAPVMGVSGGYYFPSQAPPSLSAQYFTLSGLDSHAPVARYGPSSAMGSCAPAVACSSCGGCMNELLDLPSRDFTVEFTYEAGDLEMFSLPRFRFIVARELPRWVLGQGGAGATANAGTLTVTTPVLSGRGGMVALCAGLVRLGWMQGYFKLRLVRLSLRVQTTDFSLPQLLRLCTAYLTVEVGLWVALLRQTDRVALLRHSPGLLSVPIQELCHRVNRLSSLDDYSGHSYRSLTRLLNPVPKRPLDPPYILDLTEINPNPAESSWVVFHNFPRLGGGYCEIQPWLTLLLLFVHNTGAVERDVAAELVGSQPSGVELTPEAAVLALFSTTVRHPVLYQHVLEHLACPTMRSRLPVALLLEGPSESPRRR